MTPVQLPEVPAPVFFITDCEVCGQSFRTGDEDEGLCARCAADERMQLDMDRDLG